MSILQKIVLSILATIILFLIVALATFANTELLTLQQSIFHTEKLTTTTTTRTSILNKDMTQETISQPIIYTYEATKDEPISANDLILGVIDAQQSP